jgi:hypothetical protein
MGILQWNVNGLCTCIPELDIICRRMPQQQFLYKKCTSILLTLPLSEAIPHIGMTIWLVRGQMVILPSLFEAAYIAVWSHCKPPYKLLLYGYSQQPSNLQCAICSSHPTLLLAWRSPTLILPTPCPSSTAGRLRCMTTSEAV